jgi:hypothetical protein
MRQVTLKDYGWCRIYMIDDKYYMSFDEGGVVIGMNDYEVSEVDARSALESEIEAERIARLIQNKKYK